jgi:hypothetical protein
LVEGHTAPQHRRHGKTRRRMPLIQLQNQLQTIHARLVPATWGATMALPQLSNKQQAPQYSFPSALQSRYLFGNSTAYAWLLSENVAPKCIGLKMVRREVVPTVAGTFGATLGSEHGWTHDHTDMFSLRSQRNTQPSRRKAIHVPPTGHGTVWRIFAPLALISLCMLFLTSPSGSCPGLTDTSIRSSPNPK